MPLIYLAWTSVNRVDLTSPWIKGFAGADNYSKMLGDPRFWNSLELTVIYTGTTVVLQMLIGLGLALLVIQIPRGQGLLRVAAIIPIVLAPVVVGLFWRTLVLSLRFRRAGFCQCARWDLGSMTGLGDPTWRWPP